jgi:hyaluronoglucosaminidase
MSANALIMLALVTLGALAGLARAQPCLVWTFFDDFNCPDCPAASSFGLADHNRTQTGSGCNTPGCKSWSQGVFPTLRKSSNGSIEVASNGGVPQAADLDLHLETLRKGVVEWLPDPDYDGNAVLDFEAWTPIWAGNDALDPGWHWIGYQLYSIELVKQAHPDWNDSQILATAASDFQTAGTEFFVATLEALRQLRPKAKWGFYGFPDNPYMPCIGGTDDKPTCGYNAFGIGDVLRGLNDQVQAVFNASTGLFPSVYVPPNDYAWSSSKFSYINAQYIASVTQEAVRVARNGPPGIVVRPFLWSFYHNGTTTLSPQDTVSSVTQTFFPPTVDGAVLWGDSEGMKTESLMVPYFSDLMGPSMLNFTSQQCQCSAIRCSGHGTCGSKGCVCVDGYTGANCTTPA